jgi:hypothetical protein
MGLQRLLRDPTHVLHVVEVRRVLPRRGSVARTETWLDAGRDRRRVRRSELAGGTWRVTQDELVSSGIWTVLQTEHDALAGPGPTRWMNALIYDADSAGAWRTSGLSAMEAVVGSASVRDLGASKVLGTAVRRLEARPREGGFSAVIDLRARDGLPLRAVVTELAADGSVFERDEYTFSTFDLVPRAEVPSGTFALAIPKGLQTLERRTLSPGQAALMKNPRAWWLGPSSGDLALLDGTFGYYRQEPESAGAWMGNPTLDEQVLRVGPKFEGPRVTALYTGSGTFPDQVSPFSQATAPLIAVVSYRRVPPGAWSASLPESRALASARREGVWSFEVPLQRGTAVYAVVDKGDATVVVEGIGIARSRVEDAARSLVRVR